MLHPKGETAPQSRSGAHSLSYKSSIYIFGGYTWKGGEYFNDIYEYKTIENIWYYLIDYWFESVNIGLNLKLKIHLHLELIIHLWNIKINFMYMVVEMRCIFSQTYMNTELVSIWYRSN
jgi:hypothetical protein